METVAYNGWQNNVRLANDEVELIVTKEVGPRVIRFGFIGKRNIFGEMEGEQGGKKEPRWMLRGGHRLWIAPEDPPTTCELDNEPVRVEELRGGVRTLQRTGPVSGVQKTMDITLAAKANRVRVLHTLVNRGRKPVTLAPWALSVMARRGVAIIPLPEKIPGSKLPTPNQTWSIWGYADLADPRWTFGSRYVFFRQDPARRSPNKLGIAHREGWVAYWLDGFLFVKRFGWVDGLAYPDGGVNFETYADRRLLELESLGPVTTLLPGASVVHEEVWDLHRDVPVCKTEKDVDRHVLPRLRKDGGLS